MTTERYITKTNLTADQIKVAEELDLVSNVFSKVIDELPKTDYALDSSVRPQSIRYSFNQNGSPEINLCFRNFAESPNLDFFGTLVRVSKRQDLYNITDGCGVLFGSVVREDLETSIRTTVSQLSR